MYVVRSSEIFMSMLLCLEVNISLKRISYLYPFCWKMRITAMFFNILCTSPLTSLQKSSTNFITSLSKDSSMNPSFALPSVFRVMLS